MDPEYLQAALKRLRDHRYQNIKADKHIPEFLTDAVRQSDDRTREVIRREAHRNITVSEFVNLGLPPLIKTVLYVKDDHVIQE